MNMAISSPSSLLDSLFCSEEQVHQWNLDDDEYDQTQVFTQTTLTDSSNLHLPTLDQQDFFWEDEELVSLFTKEEQQHTPPSTFSFDQIDPSLLLARKEAAHWILKVKAHYGFTPLTAILSINYLDRFLSSLHFQKDKPWMIQLVAVTCLSLAAKVEETQVPLLLDLQVEDTTYLFEAKNIQKMELLVMSTLKWRMNPVTPISFLDHIVRRLGLKNHLHWDFFKKCEALILSVVSDARFVRYKPSVLATAAMLHVIDQVDPSNSIDYQSQLLDVLKTTKEKVKECYEMIVELSISKTCYDKKRKHDDEEQNENKNKIFVGSPAGVIMDFSCDENSYDSWSPLKCPSSSSVFSSPYHHHHNHLLLRQIPFKKMRNGQQLDIASLSCRAFMDVTASPR